MGKGLFIFLFMFILINIINATHYRYGTISWYNTNDPRFYTGRVKVGFRYSFFPENGYGTPVVGTKLTYGTLYAVYYIDHWFWGTGWDSDSIDATFTVDNVDKTADWLTGYLSFSCTFPSYGVPSKGAYLGYEGSARLTTLKNNAGSDWDIEAFVPWGSTNQVSPVSGMLPIVPAYFGQVNSIPVIATSSQNPSVLKYSLSTWTGFSQPTGLSIDSTSGMMSYNPASVGLWSALIVVCDTVGTKGCVDIDFLINVTTKPVTPDLPPYFVTPPSPAAGSYVDFTANIPMSFQLQGKSPQSSSIVTISTSSFPENMSVTAQVPANTNTMTFSWKPSTSQIGVYVFNAGLADQKGLGIVGGVYSFFLRVTNSICGNGSPLPSGACQCDPGWTGTQCTTCTPDRYGPLCLPLPPCSHGTSSNGTYGDGKCICDPGWQGPACNVSVVKRCSLTDPSSIISSSTAAGSSVTPDFVQASIAASASALQVPIVLNNKNLIPAEVFILFDTSVPAASNARYTTFKTTYANFKAYIQSKREIINFGLGTFSDTAGQSNTFQLNANFGPDIGNVLSSITIQTGNPSANIQYTVLLDAISKIGFSNTGTMKIIYLVTDNNLAPTDSTLITKLAQALDNRNVLLGIFCLDSVSSYTPLLAASGSGNAYAWPTSTTTPWFQLFVDNLYTPLSTNVVVKVKSDDYKFISTPPASPTTTTTWNTALTMPTTAPAVLSPQVQINVVGYERQTIAIAINHAPTTNSLSISTNSGTSTSFSVFGNDIDSNILTIQFSQLPTRGTITVSGVNATLNTQYPLPSISTNGFQFIPYQYKYGNDSAIFLISDGCLSAQGNIGITIIGVNNPPTCSGVSVLTDQNTVKNFTLAASDVDNDVLTVEVSSTSSISSLGLLQIGGVTVTDGTKYPLTTVFSFIPFVSSNNGSVSIPFIARDFESSVQCLLTLSIARVNVPPTITGQSPVTTIPASYQVIPFSVSDPDNGEILTVSVTAATPVGGQFFGSNNQTITVNSPVGSFDVSTTHSASGFIYYQSANNQDPGVSITLTVTDNFGATSSKTINILITGNRTNAVPVASPVSDITLDQDTLSPVFLLNGTDADQPRFDNILNIQLSVRPQFGTLQTTGGSSLPSALSTPLQVVYKPNPGFYGNDQLTFYVTDSLGAVSNSQIVNFIVNHVNHPPVIAAPDVFATGAEGAWPTVVFNVVASDPDSMDTISVSVTAAPPTGTLLQSDNTPITTVPTIITNSSLYLQYSPSRTVFYSFVQPYTVKVCDNGVGPLCASSSANIHFTYTNSAPIGKDLSFVGYQDTPTKFAVVGSDFENGLNVNFFFAQLPTSGKLYDQSGGLVNLTTQLYSTPNFTYEPNPGASNDDTPGRLGPLEHLYYVVVDQNNTQSNNYQIQLFIKPVKPPIYKGEKNFTTLEDTPLSISLNAISQYGNQFYIKFVSVIGLGQISYCATHTDCSLVLNGGNNSQPLTGPPFNLLFKPPPNLYGDNMLQVSFILVEEYESPIYTIHINVEPVNDPPVFIPLNYTRHGDSLPIISSTITITMNTTTLISWNASDIDSPYQTINSTLQSHIRSGTLLSYTGQPTPTSNSVAIGKNDTIPRSADGLWRVFYTPTPGRSGNGFESISLNVIDDQGLSSMIYTIKVDVTRINLPPVVTANKTYWETMPKTQVSVIGVSVDDPDSLYNDIMFNLTLSPSTAGNISLPFTNGTKACSGLDTYSISCTAPKGTLNVFLLQIRINVTEPGNYTLTVFVSDLGFVGGNVLTDSKNVDIAVLQYPTSKPDNKTVLSAAIAGAAVGAALIALGIWRLVRAKVPPTDAFFGDSPFADANVSSNPLYKESGLSGVNPLYQEIN